MGKWKAIFNLVTTLCVGVFDLPSIDDLLAFAQDIYKKLFDSCCLVGSDHTLTHKVVVKVIEMHHWCFNQDECGYGSNRQHQLLWWLNMKAGLYHLGDQQPWGPWNFGNGGT